MTLYDQLIGNGLIAFSDPAGAKAGLSVAKILASISPCSRVKVVSNKSYPFFTDWHLPVEVVDYLPETLPEDVNWVFTGTSHPDSSHRFELHFLQLAKNRNIPSWSFIDHWTLMAMRFEDGKGNSILPDHIIVLDEYAKELAIADGLPAEKLELHKNPYLDYIENHWEPKQTNIEFRKRLNLDTDLPIVLYAPDPLTLRGEDVIYGYDEGQVLSELLEIASTIPCQVLVKAHPLQPMDVLQSVIRNNPQINVTLISSQIDNLDLMANSDVIIGFFSNFLIEAAALGKSIIRYFPETSPDLIGHLKIGVRVFGRKELLQQINSSLNRKHIA